jgi:hypothetical protein
MFMKIMYRKGTQKQQFQLKTCTHYSDRGAMFILKKTYLYLHFNPVLGTSFLPLLAMHVSHTCHMSWNAPI